MVDKTKREARFWYSVDVRGADECWPWLGSTGGSGDHMYGRVTYLGYTTGAHRIAYMLKHKIDTLPHGVVIRHTCDTPICCNPDHLRAGDQWLNTQDMMNKRSAVKRSAVLTDDQVREIRARYLDEDVTMVQLGHDYGVTNVTVSRVIKRLTSRFSNITCPTSQAALDAKRTARSGVVSAPYGGLSVNQISAVRSKYRAARHTGGVTLLSLACEYRVPVSTIRNVLRY